jgi:hypothetical protein
MTEGTPNIEHRTSNIESAGVFALVPKLRLGTQMGAKLCFAGGGVYGQTTRWRGRGRSLHAKRSFARNVIPKRSLGTSASASNAACSLSAARHIAGFVLDVGSWLFLSARAVERLLQECTAHRRICGNAQLIALHVD